MKQILLLFSLLLFCSIGFAQSVVKGRVVDEDTREGIPFCNIFIEGTTVGVSSDIDGYYDLSTKEKFDTLTVSAIGYQPKEALVKPSLDTQTINFLLSAESLTLNEVVVLAGENPANAIVRGIVEQKDNNRIDKLASYQYESYSKVELDLANIDPKLQKGKLLEPFAFVFENIDSTTDEKPFLPVYINESLSNTYHVLGEGKPKSIIKAQRATGTKNQTVIEYIKRIHQDYSIYDDWIYVLDKPFASPFSKAGLGYYEYYIIDSTMINGYWSYKLKFKPKRKQENTFFGDFWVADSVFAVQRVNMRMSPDVNINLVSRIIIYEEFAPENGNWIPQKEKMIVDFTPTKGTPGMIARRTETFKDFAINQQEIQEKYEEKETYYRLDEVEKDDDEFWQSVRHEPLSETEATIYAMIDSIKNVPAFKTYINVAEAVFGGYLSAGPVEFGPYPSTYSANPVEGNRFRIGLRTTDAFVENIRLESFLAYGLKDEEFKYGGSFKWLISKQPRTMVGAGFIDDVSFNSENSEAFAQGDLFTGVLRRDLIQKLIRVKEGKVFYERYWKNGLSNRLTLLHRQMDPYGSVTDDGRGFNYAYLTNPGNQSDVDTTITTTEVMLKTRYAINEYVIDGEFNRASFGSKQPIIELQYTLGVSGVWGSDYNYHKLALSYRHYFFLNPVGWMSYRVRAGKVFGTVPFLLMEVHPGNEGYFVGREIFNMMTRYEFASDTYVAVFLEHHFDGFLLNKVPLLRKLDFRTYATFKGVMGSISKSNLEANRLNTFTSTELDTYAGFRAPNKRPYMEASIGIENIFKIFQVEALWRLSYLDNPQARQFGFRVGVAFYF